jgi:hypothetical protein
MVWSPASGKVLTVKRLLRPRILLPLALVGVIVFAAALYLFQPWRLFTTVEVYEAVPTSVTDVNQETTDTPSLAAVPSISAPPGIATDSATQSSAQPVVLAEGILISHEHSTSGTVRILQLDDGTRVLRLENLKTSDGPMLEVWLTDAPVISGTAGWGVFDDGRYVSLGALKGNVGNQNYRIPDDVNLSDYTSVSIWCARFHVSFGAAELKAAT